jgi:hypothetical protein
MTITAGVKIQGGLGGTGEHGGKSNGSAPAADFADAALADIDAAVALPNIDGRQSVLTELPKDLFVEGREDYEIPEERGESDAIKYGRPGGQDIVHCHPDMSRKKVVLAIKEKRGMGNKIYPVTGTMLAQYPRLRRAARPFVIRQYVSDESIVGLWPAPLPQPFEENTSDIDHLRAQEESTKGWVRLE